MPLRQRNVQEMLRISTIWSTLPCVCCTQTAGRLHWRKPCPSSSPKLQWTSIRTPTPCRMPSSVHSPETRPTCSWSVTSSRAFTAFDWLTRPFSLRNTAASVRWRTPLTGSRAVSCSGRISVHERPCWTRATICLPPSWARPWAISCTRTRRRCTSARTTIRSPEMRGTRPKSCSWTRTDSARTMMRRIRPNSKHGLPRSEFVRCSTKAFR